ncbi:MAG: DUF2157 domain-containing protein [Verrucomicrobia bacterium]|nr:DUF2157 domain-containing protein [Verrucomicrobiota bacterium]MBU4292167.1 DUF2157 domain-containing protein [Verrucomicrobiota bacterium]MBU4429995.1 DUF2157 domain-containing protein [Verrucomicrobiota bacterium]MCG2681612.1 DUF2157 domain-containing protein [Kiritimatiellia bacterium]
MSLQQLHQWIRGEIDLWSRDGLVSPAQAETLRRRYPVAESGTAWGMIVFSSLGAVITGLGVILLFAYNWHAIPKFAKLALVLGTLAAVHGLGLRLFLASARFRNLGEGLCLLGTMLFGAGIWLVAQIYHIEEHFPNAFLIWGLGALVLGLVMPSIPQAILAAILLTTWCGVERIEFDTLMLAAPLLLAGVLGGMAWWRKSRLLLGVLLLAFTISIIFTLPDIDHHPWLIFCTILNLGVLWIALRFLVRMYGRFPESAPVFGIFGWTIFYVTLYLLCFPDMHRHILHIEHELTGWVRVAWLAPFILTLLAWLMVLWKRILVGNDPDPDAPGFEIYLAPLVVLLVLCGILWPATFGGWFLSAPCNLVLLAFALALMARGCRQTQPGAAITGSILLIALAVARYFDIFDSLFIRGLVFIIIGAVIFAEGYLYARTKKCKIT